MNTAKAPLHHPLKQAKSFYKKRWIQAATLPKYAHLKPQNDLMNTMFMSLIKKVKTLYIGRNEFAYERDSRHDSTQNCSTMHCFITKTVYLELTCDFVEHKCYVHFDFERCPFEQQIREYLKAYPIIMASKQEPRNGGVAAYFARVKAYQPSQYFFTL